MAKKVFIDDIRIGAIENGVVYVETRSGEGYRSSCIPIGQYRAFLATATKQVDGWLASQRQPITLVPRMRIENHG